MKLKVERAWKKTGYTIGRLYVDGVFFCNTLEDQDRGLNDMMPVSRIKALKVYGQTAIPTGIYEIDMDTVSQKFRTRMWAMPYDGKLPRLKNVKGFDGVLIHVGNKAQDTLGCVLVGKNTVKGGLTASTTTFHTLMDLMLLAYGRKEKITIEIV